MPLLISSVQRKAWVGLNWCDPILRSGSAHCAQSSTLQLSSLWLHLYLRDWQRKRKLTKKKLLCFQPEVAFCDCSSWLVGKLEGKARQDQLMCSPTLGAFLSGFYLSTQSDVIIEPFLLLSCRYLEPGAVVQVLVVVWKHWRFRVSPTLTNKLFTVYKMTILIFLAPCLDLACLDDYRLSKKHFENKFRETAQRQVAGARYVTSSWRR